MFRLLSLLACLAVSTPLWADIDQGREFYLNGQYPEAIAILRPLAEAGDPVAQNVLGDAYDEGRGVTQDIKLAEEWFLKSAAQGYVKAQYNLGLFYRNGRPGVPRNFAKAIRFYEAAIEQGYSFAMNNRAVMFLNGIGGKEDPASAAEMFQRAVDLGNLDSMHNLADLYRTGEGVEMDTGRALDLYQRGAKDGHPAALNALGAMYENGIEVPADKIAALAIYRLAMERGYATAAVNIAFLMSEEDAYWFDPVAGLAHCYWAEGQAETEAQQQDITMDCRGLAARLSDDEVTRAHALAETF